MRRCLIDILNSCYYASTIHQIQVGSGTWDQVWTFQNPTMLPFLVPWQKRNIDRYIDSEDGPWDKIHDFIGVTTVGDPDFFWEICTLPRWISTINASEVANSLEAKLKKGHMHQQTFKEVYGY